MARGFREGTLLWRDFREGLFRGAADWKLPIIVLARFVFLVWVQISDAVYIAEVHLLYSFQEIPGFEINFPGVRMSFCRFPGEIIVLKSKQIDR